MAIDDDVNPSSESDGSRRTFIKRMAVGAIAVPVVSSFAMDGLMSPAGAATASNQSGGGSNQIKH